MGWHFAWNLQRAEDGILLSLILHLQHAFFAHIYTAAGSCGTHVWGLGGLEPSVEPSDRMPKILLAHRLQKVAVSGMRGRRKCIANWRGGGKEAGKEFSTNNTVAASLSGCKHVLKWPKCQPRAKGTSVCCVCVRVEG